MDDGALAAVGDVIGRHRPFEARFEHCVRFPGILYLVPEPDIPFRRLTEAIADRWPETPPFGGQFDEVVPHLTIAQGQDDAVLEEAEADLRGRLPITARVSSVDLMVHDGTRWQQSGVIRAPVISSVGSVVRPVRQGRSRGRAVSAYGRRIG
ncbi:2'-5' RNA ligase family protein [Streptomyces canus]